MRLTGQNLRILPLHLQEQVGLAILARMEENGPDEEGAEEVKCDPRVFSRCPYNKTCGSIQDADFKEGSDCHLFNNRILANPVTNGDRIRGMNDMELANFLYTITRACADRDCDKCPIGQQNCIVMLYWVKQPAEEI